MIDFRDPTKFTVWLITGDRQGSMFGGNFDTKEEAESSIPEWEEELRSMCNEDVPFDEDCYYQIEHPESEGGEA